MKKIELKCFSCGCSFDKLLKEYNRQLKNGREKFFCSRSCAGKQNADNFGEYKGDTRFFIHGHNRSDEYTPFRTFMRRVKNRKVEAGREYNIDLIYLKEIWEKQKGICPYTNVKLVLEDKVSNPNYSASLDRIDSEKGYVKGNIQFVSLTVNHAKNKFNDLMIEEFFSIIKNNGVA